jgi:Flp pilus assembly pilin Flp
MKKLIRNRKGQGLVEYALIIAGVALIGVVGITMFGHKVADLIGTVAAVLPGAHTDDNGPITAGQLVGTTVGADGAISVDTQSVTQSGNTIGNNLLGAPTPAGPTGNGLVTESNITP